MSEYGQWELVGQKKKSENSTAAKTIAKNKATPKGEYSLSIVIIFGNSLVFWSFYYYTNNK